MARVVGALVVLAGLAGAGYAGYRLSPEADTVPVASSAGSFVRSQPAPGDPPLIWVSGEIDTLDESSLLVREGAGARVKVERLAGDATRFLELVGDTWEPMAGEDVGAVEAGEGVCVEAFLDGQTLLAIRVFVGTGCGPA